MVARLSPQWHKKEEGLHCPDALQRLLPLHSATFQPFLLVYKKELGLRLCGTMCLGQVSISHINPISYVVSLFLLLSPPIKSLTSLAAKCSPSCGVKWPASNLHSLLSLMASHCTPAQKGDEEKESYNGKQNFTQTCKIKENMKIIGQIVRHLSAVGVGRQVGFTYRQIVADASLVDQSDVAIRDSTQVLL